MRMRILLRGKTEGFTFLKTLIFIIPLMLIISVLLLLYAYALRTGSNVRQRAYNVLSEENTWIENELQK